MFKSNATSPEMEMQRLLDQVREVCAGIEPSPALRAATERLIEARNARDEIWARFQALLREVQKKEHFTNDPVDLRVEAAKEENAKAEGLIRKCEAEVEALREKHNAMLAEKLAPFHQVVDVVVNCSAAILVEMDSACAKEHKKLPLALTYSATLERLNTHIAHAQRVKVNKSDSGYDQAAAALAARKKPIRNAGAVQTTGKLKVPRLFAVAGGGAAGGGGGSVVPDTFKVNQGDGSVSPKPAAPARGLFDGAREAASSAIGGFLGRGKGELL